MKIVKIISPIALTIVGVSAVFGGEIDDSPGLGGIGIILICIATYLNYKFSKK